MTKETGKLALVFHAHLPYVLGHGSWPHGTDWLNEAAAESYIPLLDVLYALTDEGLSPKVTFSITPVLAEQLDDESFKDSFDGYLDQQIRTASDNRDEFARANDHERARLAGFWQTRYEKIADSFHDNYGRSLCGAFRRLQDEGHIEIATSMATHAYAPLLLLDESIQAQVCQGVKTYERIFGRKPAGFWLPECGYRPRYEWAPPLDAGVSCARPRPRRGVDEFLSASDVGYTVVDSHLLKGGKAIGAYADRFEALKRLKDQYEKHFPLDETDRSPYRVHFVDSSTGAKPPLAILTRDPKTGLQVWSGERGYPGDANYLEFHKKHSCGGLRYWRVTHAQSDLTAKELYDPQLASERTRTHAEHFVHLVRGILAEESHKTGQPAVLCAPYDAELFGHWWFEGPEWLGALVREIRGIEGVDLATGSECVEAAQADETISLPEGSWGEGGFHWIWLNEQTLWMWTHIYRAEERMRELVRRIPRDGECGRVLCQAARELMLLQSSDWQFLITTQGAPDYAKRRVLLHSDNFNRLCDIAEAFARGEQPVPEDRNFVSDCEEAVRLFPDLSLDWYREAELPEAA